MSIGKEMKMTLIFGVLVQATYKLSSWSNMICIWSLENVCRLENASSFYVQNAYGRYESQSR